MNEAAPYYFPVDRETDQRIRKQVCTKAVKRSHDNFEFYADEMPGDFPVSGRELLAFFRSTDQSYWEARAATYPQRAAKDLLLWGALARRYGGMVA